MREKSQIPEIEAELNAILEEYGAFLRQTITVFVPERPGDSVRRHRAGSAIAALARHPG